MTTTPAPAPRPNLVETTDDILMLIGLVAPKLRMMPKSPERDELLLPIIADYFETDFADDSLRHSIILTMINSRI